MGQCSLLVKRNNAYSRSLQHQRPRRRSWASSHSLAHIFHSGKGAFAFSREHVPLYYTGCDRDNDAGISREKAISLSSREQSYSALWLCAQ